MDPPLVIYQSGHPNTVLSLILHYLLLDIKPLAPLCLPTSDWVDPDVEPEDLQLLLNPYDGEMVKLEVDRAVGNVKNNSPELVEPLDQQAS